MSSTIKTVTTRPFEGQKPGTSGLRKQVPTFAQAHYTENFVQATLEVALEGKKPSEVTLVLGGDGRFYSKVVIETIIAMAAANGVGKLLVAQNGIMSTPSISAVIRAHKADGGIILTASHNPGGPDGDFGIKYNCENGGPAPDQVTNDIFARTKHITEYQTLEPKPVVDVSRLGTKEVVHSSGKLVVEVIDTVNDYLALLKSIFDFPKLRAFLANKKILIDAMNGVMGPYVQRILVDELGAPQEAAIRCMPLEDFGGHHPDPNLTYAADLVSKLQEGEYFLGAAFDGDGDRNMILGHKGFFVTPSDSLAVLAENLEVIPYFATGVKGYARSMPTSRAVDLVAAAKKIDVYETPTGWKYFGNLMDAGRVSICGEESFGTGSDHIREKDGLWAVLAWLSVLAAKGAASVEAVLRTHWSTFGRYYYARYDYENCESIPCEKMIAELKTKITAASFAGTEFKAADGTVFTVERAFDYAYTNHLTGETESAGGHGLVVYFNGGTVRAIYRLSGTGSSGATVRVYLEQFVAKEALTLDTPATAVVAPLAEIALAIAKLSEFTGRNQPTVIT